MLEWALMSEKIGEEVISMADQDTESKKSSSCFGNMQEMMRNMMGEKTGLCCPCAEMRVEMMSKCCPVGKKDPTEKTDQEAPK